MVNKLLIGLIIGLVIGLAIGLLTSHLIFNNHKGFPGRNFQFNMTESQINETNSFFNENHTSSEINSYCEQNRINCMYYCKNINPNHEICNTINFQPGNQTPKGGQ